MNIDVVHICLHIRGISLPVIAIRVVVELIASSKNVIGRAGRARASPTAVHAAEREARILNAPIEVQQPNPGAAAWIIQPVTDVCDRSVRKKIPLYPEA